MVHHSVAPEVQRDNDMQTNIEGSQQRAETSKHSTCTGKGPRRAGHRIDVGGPDSQWRVRIWALFIRYHIRDWLHLLCDYSPLKPRGHLIDIQEAAGIDTEPSQWTLVPSAGTKRSLDPRHYDRV